MMMQIDKERFNEVFEEMCEEYCFYYTLCKSEETLRKHCAECPLNNIECEDYWEEKKRGNNG